MNPSSRFLHTKPRFVRAEHRFARVESDLILANCSKFANSTVHLFIDSAVFHTMRYN
jgi:hypothetical protein